MSVYIATIHFMLVIFLEILVSFQVIVFTLKSVINVITHMYLLYIASYIHQTHFSCAMDEANTLGFVAGIMG